MRRHDASATLTINGQTTDGRAGARRSSSTPSGSASACRRPAASRASARSAWSRSTEGMELLSPPTDARSSTSRATSASRASAASTADAGDVRCHTMRRGQMRIERHALELAGPPRRLRARPGGDARRRSHPHRRRGNRPLDRPDPRPRHGPRHDHVVLRLFDLETGELVADASFENPQRFGGSDVMARIHYDTEHRGKLLLRTLAGYLTHAIEELPVDPQIDLRDGRRRQLDDARPVLPARACTRSARARTTRSPRSRWPRASARRPA